MSNVRGIFLMSIAVMTFNHIILNRIYDEISPHITSWTITKAMKKDIDCFGTRCYHYMLGIRRIDQVRNEDALKKVRKNNLSNLLYKRQLRSLGHCNRKDDIITNFDLYINNNGRNRRGRTRLNYNEQIERITSFYNCRAAKKSTEKRGVEKRCGWEVRPTTSWKKKKKFLILLLKQNRRS